jgi:hypothetical protein
LDVDDGDVASFDLKKGQHLRWNHGIEHLDHNRAVNGYDASLLIKYSKSPGVAAPPRAQALADKGEAERGEIEIDLEDLEALHAALENSGDGSLMLQKEDDDDDFVDEARPVFAVTPPPPDSELLRQTDDNATHMHTVSPFSTLTHTLFHFILYDSQAYLITSCSARSCTCSLSLLFLRSFLFCFFSVPFILVEFTETDLAGDSASSWVGS